MRRCLSTHRAAPQQARLTYAAVRGHIKEWCVVSRTYQDDGIFDTSSGHAPMDVSQMKGKGKPNKGFKGKPWDKGKSKDKSSKGDGKKSGKKDGKSSWPEQFQGDCGTAASGATSEPTAANALLLKVAELQ